MKIGVERRVLTEAVLTAARTTGKPIGDAEAPRHGTTGWDGQPNQEGSNFTPYSVITPMQAGSGSGPFDDSQGDVVIPYAITSYGASREQCEWMADRVRASIHSLNNTEVVMWSGTSDQYSRMIQLVMEQQIGQVQRVDQTDPSYYSETDVVALWTSR